MQKAWCRYCNSNRPYTHIYCYVCGKELILPTSKKEDNRYGKCKFCGDSFIPDNERQAVCNKPVCQTLIKRLYAINHLRRERGLENLETFEHKNCEICGEPLPLELISNSRRKYCSPVCKEKSLFLNHKKWEIHGKINGNGNGKEHLP